MNAVIRYENYPGLIPGVTPLLSRSSRSITKNPDALITEVIRDRQETVTWGQRLREVLASLCEVYKDCSEENWDGYGGQAVTQGVYNEALKLIGLLQQLPPTIPVPAIGAEPDGAIGLEWYKAKQQVFVVSVEGKNTITYAGIFNGNKIHGTWRFGDTLPDVITENLRRLYL